MTSSSCSKCTEAPAREGRMDGMIARVPEVAVEASKEAHSSAEHDVRGPSRRVVFRPDFVVNGPVTGGPRSTESAHVHAA